MRNPRAEGVIAWQTEFMRETPSIQIFTPQA
jgi:hypothetical protein